MKALEEYSTFDILDIMDGTKTDGPLVSIEDCIAELKYRLETTGSFSGGIRPTHQPPH